MGDTRIDGSAPKNPYPECDEETGVCGAVKKSDPEVSRDLSVELSTQHVRTKVSLFHEERRVAVGDGELSLSADAGVAHYGMGVKNSDGS